MFAIGDYVVCGNKGVCKVENITTLNISGVDKEREYFILKPVYLSASTVYVPVDSIKESLRPVMERDEAQRLMDSITEIPPLIITNDKLSEQTYKDCFKSGKCEEWVKIIKTIWLRKQKRLQAGRKITAVDAKYFHLAEESLCGELAVALGKKREEVQSVVDSKIGEKAVL